MLSLADQLLQAVHCEAHVCCVRQPVILAGDLDADPRGIPPWPKVSLMEGGLTYLMGLDRSRSPRCWAASSALGVHHLNLGLYSPP